MKKYFVINDKQQFLWEDGNFYNAFVKLPFAVDESDVEHFREKGFIIEEVSPRAFPQLFPIPTDERQERITRVRCTGFALATVLDRLCSDPNIQSLWVSLEDSDFLISFIYVREYERRTRNPQDTCLPKQAEAGE